MLVSKTIYLRLSFSCSYCFTEELREHFGQYGDIESINVKTDPQTGRSRGFAFIVYAAAEAIDKVTAAGEHIINNKKVDPKKAKARHGKIFVGGLTTDISDEEIKTFFGQFGNVSCECASNCLAGRLPNTHTYFVLYFSYVQIVEVEMPFDKQKNQRKGFCFITFDSEQVVNELLKTPKQTISGREVDVKKATPKPENAPAGLGPRGQQRGRGGRGECAGIVRPSKTHASHSIIQLIECISFVVAFFFSLSHRWIWPELG